MADKLYKYHLHLGPFPPQYSILQAELLSIVTADPCQTNQQRCELSYVTVIYFINMF